MTIEYEDFVAVEMRTGRIVEVRDFPGTHAPSYQVMVDFGPDFGERWSSMQAAADYRPADLVDTQVVAVVNLPPKKIRGFASEVLILGVPATDGGLSLLRPDRAARLGDRVY